MTGERNIISDGAASKPNFWLLNGNNGSQSTVECIFYILKENNCIREFSISRKVFQDCRWNKDIFWKKKKLTLHHEEVFTKGNLKSILNVEDKWFQREGLRYKKEWKNSSVNVRKYKWMLTMKK